MKKAFTMLELIFVIIVIGILAAIMIPQMKSDKTREAAIQLVSHIRYTQHLAMVDDKYGQNIPATATNWFKGRWQIVFEYASTDPMYSIYSDSTGFSGQANHTEVAIDPLNKSKILSGGGSSMTSALAKSKFNAKLHLKRTYGITDISLTGGCGSNAATRISFDHLGRPIDGTIDSMSSPYEANKLISTTCNVILTGADGSVTISIEPETGYARII